VFVYVRYFNLLSLLQVTKGMFGARKKFVEFVEAVDNDFTDDSMYYSQPSIFPHRSDKDVSFVHTPAHRCHFFRRHQWTPLLVILLFLVLKCFPSDAVLSLAVVVGAAVAARCKFVRSTE